MNNSSKSVRVSALVNGKRSMSGFTCVSLEESFQKLLIKISGMDGVDKVQVTAGIKDNGEFCLHQDLHEHLKLMVSEVSFPFSVEAVYGLP